MAIPSPHLCFYVLSLSFALADVLKFTLEVQSSTYTLNTPVSSGGVFVALSEPA